MSNNFHIFMNNLVNFCEGIPVDEFSGGFQQLYPFTTENISGYISFEE